MKPLKSWSEAEESFVSDIHCGNFESSSPFNAWVILTRLKFLKIALPHLFYLSNILDHSSTAPSFVLDDIRYNAKTLGCIFFDILVIAGPGIKHYEVSRFPSIGSDIKHSCGQYYKIYDVVFTPLYRSKEVSVEGIHRDLLSSVWQRKYDVVNFIIQATAYPPIARPTCLSWQHQGSISWQYLGKM